MATTAPPRTRGRARALAELFDVPDVVDVSPPRWWDRLPRPLTGGLVLLVLVAISAYLRTRQLSGQLWFEEAGAVGIATHSFGALPGVLRQTGAAPLYYALLHLWIDAFGSGESATHAFSLLIGLLTVPLGMGVAFSLAGRRAALFAGIMFAFSSFLTRYAQETQPYELMVLLGLLASAGLIQGLVRRRRRWLWLLWAGLALMLYTQGTALLFVGGALAAVGLVVAAAPEPARRGLLRDAALCFGGALLVFVPWLPTAISQISHDTSPWHYAPLLGATLPSQLLGSERVDVTLLIAVLVGIAPLWSRARRRSPEAVTLWALALIPATAFVLARLGALGMPLWAWRYFAPVVAPLLLFAALASARARVVGVAAMIFCVAFLANSASFAPPHKSDMEYVAAQMGPLLHRDDLVVVAQPEQAPLAWYYLPAGVRFATTLGPVADPSYMNWQGAQERLESASPPATLAPLVATLKRGQQLLYVRPLTEGAKNWSGAWPQLVRRRSAQWGQILTTDVADGILKQVAVAPENYPAACCIADAAVLYQKTS